MAVRRELDGLIGRAREPEFSQPVRQIVLMVIVLAAVGVIGWFLYEPIATVFRANLYLNGLIGGVFLIGVIACFRAVFQLVSAVSWIEGFAVNRPGLEFTAPPGLLTSLASMLRDARSRTSLSATSTRTLLDSIATRLDESRDITRYIASLLIFLGLLGTFWGLSLTVPAVVDTIRGLAPEEGQSGAAVFDNLMTGLEDQLGGMGTAFASSLLGLAGSLVVGLLELFVGHGQNRFYRELEEWLSSITRVSLGLEGESGEAGLAAALVEQNAAQIESLSALVERNDDRRAAFEERIAQLTDAVSRLAANAAADRAPERPAFDPAALERQTALLERIAERLDARMAPDGDGLDGDAEVRARIRNIDRQLLRLLEEMTTGRQESTGEIRADLNALTRAVARLGERADAR
jgi:hypothetical protein